MLLYTKKNISGFILSLISAAGLSTNLLQGFKIPDSQLNSVTLTLGCPALLLGLLYFGFYCRQTSIITSLILFFSTVSAILFMRVSHITEVVFEQNYLFYLITFLTVLIVFILSRNAIGTVFLVLIGVTVFAFLSILQYHTNEAGYLIFLSGTSPLFFIHRYHSTARRSKAGYTSSILFPMISIFISIGALAISFSFYEFVIKPLNPPSQETAFITELKSLKVLKKTGIYSEMHLYDNNQKTVNTTNEKRTVQEDYPQQDSNDSLPNNISQNAQQTAQDFVNKSETKSGTRANAITYGKNIHLLICVILLFPVLLLSTIGIKRFSRRIWYFKTRKENRQTQIIHFYQYFIKKLQLIGYKKRPGETLDEFTGQYSRQLREFSSSYVDMKVLTDVYTKVYYGNLPASDEDYDRFLYFYKHFFKSCRKKLGRFRYSVKFLLI